MKRNFYKKNQLLQLRGFCALIEEKTIQKAARKIGTVHSNISLQIQALEKEIEMKLFEKTGKNLIPNKYALDFYQSAKKTLTELEELFIVKAKILKERNENLIRIAGHSYAFSHLLPKSFKELIEINPNIKFELHNTTRDEGLNLLDKDLVDFIIFPFLPEHYANKNFEIIDFYKCDFVIAFQKGHPIEKYDEKDLTWDNVLKYDFCTVGGQRTAQGVMDINFTSRFHLINGTWEIVAGLVRYGFSITGADIQYVHDKNLSYKRTNILKDYRFSICLKKNIFQKNIQILIDKLLHNGNMST